MLNNGLSRSAIMSAAILLFTGCASSSPADEARLNAEMVVLTQKIDALTVELKALKTKQAKEQLKTQQQMKAQKAKTQMQQKT